MIKYFVHSGDPGGWFSLDPFSGFLKTASFLDYEKYSSVLLNIQAMYGNSASTTFTQVINLSLTIRFLAWNSISFGGKLGILRLRNYP